MINKPRILVWDIETAGVNALYADLGFVVNFGYMWLGEKNVHCLLASDYPGWFRNHQINDKPLLKDALKVMDDADILVAHYGDKFDRRFVQGRCAINRLQPPAPAKQRDTWRIAKGAFKLRSNRLVDIALTLGLTEQKHQKTRDEWPGWWHRANGGDAKALKEMSEYCKQDVRTTAELYTLIRPYDNRNHPKLYKQLNRAVCALCGGDVQYRGTKPVGTNWYREYVCKDCGRWDRESKAVQIA